MAAVYVSGLQRSVWTGDSAELVTAAYTLGIPHPTGYPIYVWLGRLFTLLPVGSVALRVNAMSAVFAVAALYVAFLVVEREARRLSGSRLAGYLGGFITVMLLGHAQPFWERAQVAEVYSLSAFLMLLSIYAFFRWFDTGEVRLLSVGALVYGLGLGAHMSNVLLLPILLVVILATARSWGPVGRVTLFVAVGLTQYAFLLARSAHAAPYIHPHASFFSHNPLTGSENALHNWFWFVTGGQWHGEVAGSLAMASAKAVRLVDSVLSDLGPLGICLLGIGAAVWSYRSRPWGKAAVFSGTVICGSVYFSWYRPASEPMVLPLYGVLAALAGIGLAGASVIISGALGRVRIARSVSRAAVIALALLVAGICISKPRIDYSKRNGPAMLIAGMLEDLPDGSTVDGLEWKYEKIVEYYEVVQGAHARFVSGHCDLNRIAEGTCYAINGASDRYERMGFGLELETAIEGAPNLYQLRPPVRAVGRQGGDGSFPSP
jgi:hypothetical protein